MAQTKALVDKLLGIVSNGIFPQGYIAEKIFPELPVGQKTGIIGAYGKNHIRLETDLQTGLGEARRVTPIKRDLTNLYLIGSHALEGVVTRDDYDNVEDPYDAEADETLGLTSLILTNKESAVAGKLFDTAVVTQNTTLAGANQFSDYTNSDPLKIFTQAENAVIDGCGMSPNAAVMSMKVFNILKRHPAILDVLGFKYNQTGNLSEGDVAKAMGVKQLFIGDAPYNNAKEGQTDSLAQIWGGSILYFVRPDSAAKYQTAFGYYARMRSRKQREVYKYNLNNPIGATGIIVQDDYSYELVNVNAGYLIKNAIA